jgi:hypothetical protein
MGSGDTTPDSTEDGNRGAIRVCAPDQQIVRPKPRRLRHADDVRTVEPRSVIYVLLLRYPESMKSSTSRSDQNSTLYFNVIFLRISAVFCWSSVKTANSFAARAADSCFRITDVDRERFVPPP